MMRSISWMALFAFVVGGSTVVFGKDLSSREIYEQASPAVVMVMAMRMAAGMGVAEPVRSFSLTDWSSLMPMS